MSTGEENAMKARLVTVLATATALFVLGNGFAGVSADGRHAEPTAAPAAVATVTLERQRSDLSPAARSCRGDDPGWRPQRR
jgi:hypothetical protein